MKAESFKQAETSTESVDKVAEAICKIVARLKEDTCGDDVVKEALRVFGEVGKTPPISIP